MTNTLAYFSCTLEAEKSFKTLTPGVDQGQMLYNVYGHNLQIFVTAEVFVPGRPLKARLMCASKAEAYPSEAHFKGSNLVYAPCLTHPHIRLLQKSLPGANIIKLFYV